MQKRVLFTNPETYPPASYLLNCSYEEIRDFLGEYEFVGYHVTKLLDKSSVEKNGLRCSPEWYFETLLKNLLSIGVAEEEAKDALEMTKKRYCEKYAGRDYGICFYSIINNREKEYAEERFAAGIGGELFQQGIYRETDLYKRVSSFGTRYVVIASIAFDDMPFWIQDDIIYGFREYAKKPEKKVEVDLIVQKDIAPELLTIKEYDVFFQNGQY